MKFTNRGIGPNFKESRLEGGEAIINATFALLSQSYGTLPDIPAMGYDIDDLLFLDTFKELGPTDEQCKALASRIKTVVANESVEVEVFPGDQRIDIQITWYPKNGQPTLIPLSLTVENGKKIKRYKDIVL